MIINGKREKNKIGSEKKNVKFELCNAITRLFAYVVSNDVDDDKMQPKCGTEFSHMI